MKKLLAITLLTVMFGEFAFSQGVFLGESYARTSVVAGTESGGFTYAPNIPNFSIVGLASHLDTFQADNFGGSSSAFTRGEAFYLPSQMRLSVSCAVSGRASTNAQINYYFNVSEPVTLAYQSEAGFTSHFWADRVVSNVYEGGSLIAMFDSNNGTHNSGTTFELLPNRTYRFYLMNTRWNLYQGSPASDTNSVIATLSVLGTRTLRFYDPTFTGDWSTRTMDVQVYQGGLLVETQLNVPMLADGSFAFAPVTRGQADVRFKGTHWLSKTVTGLMLTDEVLSLEPLDLVNGDIDRDGEVGPGDFEAVVATFGATGPADIDGDGEVGPSDFETVVAHFGLADE